ncbi:MAG: hypothetical protein KAH30_04630 [Caldisericia bacterium]|nr:hypothetical protein [Caldisericia bacterium]
MNMKKNSGFTFGIILIIVGAVLLLMKFTNFNMDWLVMWPLIMVAVGLFLLTQMTRDKGAVFPATIVIGIGALFLIENMNILPRGIGMGELWPFFPIIVGLAFVALYLFDKKDTGVLIPASILLVVGAVFLSINMKGFIVYIAPIVIILVGLLIVVNGIMGKGKNSERYHQFHDERKTEGRVSSDSTGEVPIDYINEDEE